MPQRVKEITSLIREVDPDCRLTCKELGWEIAAYVSNGVEGLEPVEVARFVEHLHPLEDPTAPAIAGLIVAEFGLDEE